MSMLAVEQTGALSNTVWVALIVGLSSLVGTSIVAWTTNRRERARQVADAKTRREEKREDWDRQDEVARRAEAAAERVREVADQAAIAADRVQEVAKQAAEAATLLLERQDAAAEAAAVAAQDLVLANERLARETARAASITNGKLDQIHTLVNSNLSAALQDRLTAVEALIVALRDSSDQSEEARNRIRALEITASELQAQVNDRRRATQVAEAQVEQGEQGGLRAEWPADPPIDNDD